MKHGSRRSWALAAGWLAMGLACPSVHGSFTNDREYLFGDDGGEEGVAGQPAGVDIDGDLFTFDSAGAFQDMQVLGGPLYADVSGRPFAGSSQVGIAFDGVDDYLAAANLNLPANSVASVTQGGPENYVGLTNRGLQFWVRPGGAGANNGLAQSLVLDSNEHGVRITENDTWAMRYAKQDFDTGIAVQFDQWHHVMVVRPFGTAGGSRMYVNGVAVAFAPGGYTGANTEDLVVGSNTSLDAQGNFTGGTEEFFRGIMDDLSLFILGDNSNNGLNPPGQDWGSFVIQTDNQFIAMSLTGVDGDVNQDGVLNGDDVDDFIAGWNSRRLVNGQELGDLISLSRGDLNFDGRVDIFDAVLLDNALTGQGLAGLSFAALPEPTTLAILGIGALAIGRRRR